MGVSASMSQPQSDHTLLHHLLPGFLMGGFVSSWIGGMVVMEAIRVLYRYPKDHFLLRATVTIIMLFSVLHASTFVGIVYYYAVHRFGDFQSLDKAIPEFGLHIMLSRVVVTVSQLFFTYRLYIFSNHNIPIAIVSVGLAIYHLAISIVVSVRFIAVDLYSHLNLLPILYLLYSAAIAGDVFLAVALYVFLKTQKTQLTKTQSLINQIIMLSFQTSLITTALAVVSVIILGHASLGVIYSLILTAAQLYLLSVVVTLNSRGGFAKALADSGGRSFAGGGFPVNNIFTAMPLEGVGVQIDRVVYTDVEASTPLPYKQFAKVRPLETPPAEKIFASSNPLHISTSVNPEPLYPPSSGNAPSPSSCR